MRYTVQDFVEWVEAIQSEAWERLNSWEQDFVININSQLDEGFELTERQIDKLERMYAKYTN